MKPTRVDYVALALRVMAREIDEPEDDDEGGSSHGEAPHYEDVGSFAADEDAGFSQFDDDPGDETSDEDAPQFFGGSEYMRGDSSMPGY